MTKGTYTIFEKEKRFSSALEMAQRGVFLYGFSHLREKLAPTPMLDLAPTRVLKKLASALSRNQSRHSNKSALMSKFQKC
jgi:hypothetical protein